MSEDASGHGHQVAGEPKVADSQASRPGNATSPSGALAVGNDRPRSGPALQKYEEMVHSLKKSGIIASRPKNQRSQGPALNTKGGGGGLNGGPSPPPDTPQGLLGEEVRLPLPGSIQLPPLTKPAPVPTAPGERATDTEAGDTTRAVLERHGMGSEGGRDRPPSCHSDLQALADEEDTKKPYSEQKEKSRASGSNEMTQEGNRDAHKEPSSQNGRSVKGKDAKNPVSASSTRVGMKKSRSNGGLPFAAFPSAGGSFKGVGSFKGQLDDGESVYSDGGKEQVFKALKYNDKIVTINVSGRVFQTYVQTLRNLPGTLLANYVEPEGELLKHGHMFLDRDPDAFAAVLRYYRTDRLLQPSALPDDLWGDELLFYKIRNPVEFQMTAEEMREQQLRQGMPPNPGHRQATWLFFEDPTSSLWAKYQSVVCIFVILVAVAAAVTQTHPTFRLSVNKEFYGGWTTSEIADLFQVIETIVVTYFTIEFVGRFWSTTKKWLFCRSIENWIDFVAIVPFYIEMMPGVEGGTGLVVVRIVRLSRIFRIVGMVFKLGKYSQGAKVLVNTMIGCRKELMVLAVVFFMAITIFASSMYFCENPDITVLDSEFESVLMGMYWAGITITTVGYGDMIPSTVCGRSVACLAAISGVFCLGLPISVITTKFTEKYSDMLLDAKVEEERARYLAAKKTIQGMRGIKALGGNLSSTLGKLIGTFGETSEKSQEERLEQIMKVAVKVFKEMDDDNSDTIDEKELETAVQKLGFDLPPSAISYMMDFIDTDRSGVLEFDEFRTFVEMVVKGEIPTEEDIQTAATNANRKPRKEHQ